MDYYYRWDMRIPIKRWTQTDTRTIRNIKECAAFPSSKPAKVTLSVQHPPLFDIEINHIVPDELHLLLRIMDILIRNVILQVVAADNRAKRDGKPCDNLSKMLASIKECGITLSVWEVRNDDGKGTGKYEFTPIRGNEKKKLLEMLPTKFSNFLSETTVVKVQQLWRVKATIH